MALVRFGLTPDAFWALSVAEWGALSAALASTKTDPAPMTRDDLRRLMEGT